MVPGPPCFLFRRSGSPFPAGHLSGREGPGCGGASWPWALPLKYSSQPPGIQKLSSVSIPTSRLSFLFGPISWDPTGRSWGPWGGNSCSVTGLGAIRGCSRGWIRRQGQLIHLAQDLEPTTLSSLQKRFNLFYHMEKKIYIYNLVYHQYSNKT